MIVRNEAHVIERCLDNVGSLVDLVSIVDTGSEDQTIELIEAWLKRNGKPGHVLQRPWKNFGHNRTEALRHAETLIKLLQEKSPNLNSEGRDYEGIWYIAFMDADNETCSCKGQGPFPLDLPVNRQILRDPNYNAIRVEARRGPAQYVYTWMVRYHPEQRWKWYGPCHEYVAPMDKFKASYGYLEEGYIYFGTDGSRSRNPLKFLRDAFVFHEALAPIQRRRHRETLQRQIGSLNEKAQDGQALAKQQQDRSEHQRARAELDRFPELPIDEEAERDKGRYYYYLGQSYRDHYVMTGEKIFLKLAEHYFAECPRNGASTFDAYRGMIEAFMARSIRGKSDKKSLDYLFQALGIQPHRPEAPYYLMNYFHQRRMFRAGYSIGLQVWNAMKTNREPDLFSSDPSIGQWRFADALSICAAYVGDLNLAEQMAQQVLRCDQLPSQDRERVLNNFKLVRKQRHD